MLQEEYFAKTLEKDLHSIIFAYAWYCFSCMGLLCVVLKDGYVTFI